jgi:hypothetical protein
VSLLVLVSLVAVLALPAAAAPPTLTSVGQTSRHLTANWVLPPGGQARVIEAATSPQTSTDGYFFSENVKEFSTLEEGQTSYIGNLQLEPGTYYVHVGGYDPSCPECPSREFSTTQVVTIPPDPPPPLPTLAVATAKRHVRTVLARRFQRHYRSGYAKRVASCRRSSKIKVTCRRVSWVAGDLSYKGWVTIWLTGNGDAPVRRHSFRIKRTDEYCAATGGRKCTKTYRSP